MREEKNTMFFKFGDGLFWEDINIEGEKNE